MKNRKQHFTMSSYLLIILALLISACSTTPVPVPEVSETSPEEIVVDPLRFAKAIKQFKAADSLQMPPLNAYLFVGSSSIRGWKTLAADFPEMDVINRGFGGSHMSDLIYYFDDLVSPYQPKAILVYEGDNDIASGMSPAAFFKDYLRFIELVNGKWADLPVYFISIKPSLARVAVLEEMAQANAMVIEHMKQFENLHYVDVFSAMLGEDGMPRPDIFGHDGLHMNGTGYALWTKIVSEALRSAGE